MRYFHKYTEILKLKCTYSKPLLSKSFRKQWFIVTSYGAPSDAKNRTRSESFKQSELRLLDRLILNIIEIHIFKIKLNLLAIIKILLELVVDLDLLYLLGNNYKTHSSIIYLFPSNVFLLFYQSILLKFVASWFLYRLTSVILLVTH